MGTETLGIMACSLAQDEKPLILQRFLENAALELAQLREVERIRWQLAGCEYKLAANLPVSGWWCLGPDTFNSMLERDGWVAFELQVGFQGCVGAKAFSFWTSI